MSRYELEVWGGMTARYLRRMDRRSFRTLRAAALYAARIRDITDEMGVTAAHPVTIWCGGRDVTHDAYALIAE